MVSISVLSHLLSGTLPVTDFVASQQVSVLTSSMAMRFWNHGIITARVSLEIADVIVLFDTSHYPPILRGWDRGVFLQMVR